ncbi:MAG TPA: TonB-dependent receptor [Thermoanaerobaculia bacterium]|nr:TonB-dependent receptor [Thermoanaerobaculia bacterium]
MAAVPASAQFQSGNIYGTVTDSSGSRLPGVTVTLSGVGAPRTFVTDEQGNYRFLNLDPANYVLLAELSGFGTVTQRNVDVNVGRNTTVDLVLRPAVSETVTVTADAPVLDFRRTGTGATIETEELENIPTARDPWVVMQQVPGVLIDRVNVGGNESGQQSVFVGKGSSMGQNTWNVDGVNITDASQAGAGFAPGYVDFDSLAEMQVTTGGTDPSIKTAGVNMNLVTKRGTNEFRGSGRFFLSDGAWQADPTVPAEAQSYLNQVNAVDHVEDFGLEVGGPIIRDRLWFWGGYAEQNVQNLAAAGLPELHHDDTFLTNVTAKFNAQVVPNNSATVVYTESAKEKFGRNAGPTRPPETTWNQGHLDEGPLVGGFPFFKIEDTHSFNQNLYLTALYSQTNHTFFFDPIGGIENETWRDHQSIFHESFWYYSSERPTSTARVDGGTFFNAGGMSHELRFGFGYRDNPTTSVSVTPGSGNWGLFFGAAQNFGLAYLTRPQVAKYGVESLDLYAGDTILLGNLTIQAGLRFDMQSGSNLPSSVPANAEFPELLPAIDFAGDKEDLKWNSISPRIGATYAIGPERQTLLRAAYNRYADQLSGAQLAGANPFPFVQGLGYYWADRNGDKHVQRSEVLFEDGLYGWYGLDPNNPGATISPTRIDYDMDVPTTDEFIIGGERAINSQFSVGINFTHRIMNNMVFSMSEKTRGSGNFYTAADWVLGGNASGTLPNGEAYSVPYYKLAAGVPAPTFAVVTNRPGYSRSYNGVELFATKRLTNRWSLRGNVSWNDWSQNVDDQWGTNGDPTVLQTPYGCSICDGSTVTEGSGTLSGNKGGVFINSRWSYVMTGQVELPWQTSIGLSLSGREGYPVPYRHTLFDGTTAKSVLVNGVDEQRLDNITNLDLRIAKEFSVMGRAGVTVSLDAFNVTDERTVVQRQHQLYTRLATVNPAANRIIEMQSPRILRLGARITF